MQCVVYIFFPILCQISFKTTSYTLSHCSS